MAIHLENLGLKLVDTPQGFQLSEAARTLAKLVVDQKLVHDGDPILAWAAGNAVVKEGLNGELRLAKEKAPDKIDPISAAVMALDRVIRHDASIGAADLYVVDPPAPSSSAPAAPAGKAEDLEERPAASVPAPDPDRELWNNPDAWRSM